MYPRELVTEIVDRLLEVRARGWSLIQSTFYIPAESLKDLFQKDQKTWNRFKYSLRKIDEQLSDPHVWHHVLSRQNRDNPGLARDLLAFGGIQDLVSWASRNPLYTDAYDMFRFTKQGLSDDPKVKRTQTFAPGFRGLTPGKKNSTI
jgi:hypothetical protein